MQQSEYRNKVQSIDTHLLMTSLSIVLIFSSGIIFNFSDLLPSSDDEMIEGINDGIGISINLPITQPPIPHNDLSITQPPKSYVDSPSFTDGASVVQTHATGLKSKNVVDGNGNLLASFLIIPDGATWQLR